MSNPDDDVLSDAWLAAGESYLENGALGHEALETLGPLGIAVSLGLEGLEGEELNNALFENMPPGPAQVGPMFIPPPFQLIPWNQAVMMVIRDYSAWVFATARFGQFMHENFGQVFADEYGVDLEDIIDNTAPGQNGPDLQLPSGMGRELGLEDNIELKPWTNGGVDRLFPQIERWGFPVSPFFYDYDGNIWHAPEILD